MNKDDQERLQELVYAVNQQLKQLDEFEKDVLGRPHTKNRDILVESIRIEKVKLAKFMSNMAGF